MKAKPLLPTALFCVPALILVLAALTESPAGARSNDECLHCHGDPDLRSEKGVSRFIEPLRFYKSVHGSKEVGCVSCHKGIALVTGSGRVPHHLGTKPTCSECHERVSIEYSTSRHAQVSERICYSCHDAHYGISFRQMSGDERRGICLKCHDATRTHIWLPQRTLHFKHLECTACHALRADIGVLFSFAESSDSSRFATVPYDRLQPFIDKDRKDLAETIDLDGDGKLSAPELDSFVRRIQREGLPDVALEACILVLNPTHDFSSKAQKAGDCVLCHSRDAQFYSKLLLQVPQADGSFRMVPVDRDILSRWGEKPFLDDFYLLGESRIRKRDLEELIGAVKKVGFKWLDLMGAFIVLCSLAIISLHAALMFVTRKARPRTAFLEEQDFPPLAVRAWHWAHGLFVILLVLSAIQLRLPDIAPIFATFLTAVNLHNLIGIVLILDYVLFIVYHLWRHRFKTLFYGSPSALVREILATAYYCSCLLFLPDDYPNTPLHERNPDPLGRLLYSTIMLFVLPIQIITGVLLFRVDPMTPVVKALGGLRVVDGIHVLAGYVLVALLIVHVYRNTLKSIQRSRSER